MTLSEFFQMIDLGLGATALALYVNLKIRVTALEEKKA